MNQIDSNLASGSVDVDDSALKSLLQLIAKGDETKLGEIYDLTVSRVYGVAYAISENEADAEEIVCDVFAKIWHCANQYDPERGKAISWILMICRSRALDCLRRHSTHREKLDHVKESTSPDLFTAEGEEANPEKLLNLLQENSGVKKAMQTLTPLQQEFIFLGFFKGYTHSEMAQLHEMPLGTVKSNVRRAIAALREKLN